MTVGKGSDKPDILAHGLYSCIDKIPTDWVVFFASKESKEDMVPRIKNIYSKNKNLELDHCHIVEIEKIDNFDYIFNIIKDEILKYQDSHRIFINYTSGTKTMTMTAGLISALYNKDLISVTGQRNDEGYIIPGTEQVHNLNLYKYKDILLLRKLKESFNSNRFEAGKILLNDITGENINKFVYEELFDAYYSFDIVDFKSAKEHFDSKLFNQSCPDLSSEQLGKNNKALNIINTEGHDESSYYILASILNNARRRADEGKYDDAIARLYRSLEYIAQIQLEKKYGINTSDVEVDLILNNENIDNKTRKIYKNKKENSEKNGNSVNIGLKEDYYLLNAFGDNLGKYFKSREKVIDDKLRFRNKSILAHGLEIQTKNNFDEFNRIVLDVARQLNQNIDVYIEETCFPEFEI